jgi:hypothetical protein
MVGVDTYVTAVKPSVFSYRRRDPDRHRGGPEIVDAKETKVLILLPLLRRLSLRTQLAVGLALTTIGLVLTIVAPVHGVIAVSVGVIFLLSASRDRLRRLT